MPKIKLTLLLLILSFLIASPVSYADDPMTKLSRGVTNVITSPLEYYYFYDSYARESNIFKTFVAGTFYGTAFMVGRIATGVYDIITFPCSWPKDYGAIIEPSTPLERY